MDMLFGPQLADAGLTDWRHLAQGIHARYLLPDFATGARFVAAIGEAAAEAGHTPSVQLSADHVDLKLVSDDAIYHDGDTKHVVQWVTAKDVDLARRITRIAAAQGLRPDPESVAVVELGLQTPSAGAVAPMWAMLLTGDAGSQGHGSPTDEVRDPSGRIPNLWFSSDEDNEGRTQRFHVEVYVAPEVVRGRIEAAIAAGGRVVDDRESPALTVIADPDGNTGVICADMSSVRTA